LQIKKGLNTALGFSAIYSIWLMGDDQHFKIFEGQFVLSGKGAKLSAADINPGITEAFLKLGDFARGHNTFRLTRPLLSDHYRLQEKLDYNL
jgi:hypothetical protein